VATALGRPGAPGRPAAPCPLVIVRLRPSSWRDGHRARARAALLRGDRSIRRGFAGYFRADRGPITCAPSCSGRTTWGDSGGRADYILDLAHERLEIRP
jgi:hypothetical protein